MSPSAEREHRLQMQQERTEDTERDVAKSISIDYSALPSSVFSVNSCSKSSNRVHVAIGGNSDKLACKKKRQPRRPQTSDQNLICLRFGLALSLHQKSCFVVCAI